MRQETFPLSQKELQRVRVINACIKADMACARAAGLLGLSVLLIKRLKKRMCEDGEATLAHRNNIWWPDRERKTLRILSAAFTEGG